MNQIKNKGLFCKQTHKALSRYVVQKHRPFSSPTMIGASVKYSNYKYRSLSYNFVAVFIVMLSRKLNALLLHFRARVENYRINSTESFDKADQNQRSVTSR
ncbi:hypothetical protein CEXT_62711 [Caerostris extrusa]|uniref:Uncharacterized protein n=1 Tax=Caerostris extrusa TaxID=172846 RepID=A0AAV4QZA9_CAEEX|nr:hypothetical protein CEXT_62711 [Caerostris extrusa]